MTAEPNPCARDRLLDAAERLVCADGAVHLTLDAVAQAARTSKGGLLYHFPSKEALLAALVQRHVDNIEQRCAQARDHLPGGLGASEMQAWILGMLQPDATFDRPSIAALVAAAAFNPALLDGVRQRYSERLAALMRSANDPALAAVVAFAVDGLMLAEIWQMTEFTAEQRARIVEHMLGLADQAFATRTTTGQESP